MSSVSNIASRGFQWSVLQVAEAAAVKKQREVGLSELQLEGSVGVLKYGFQGQTWKVYLPYDAALVYPMSDAEVIAVYRDGREVRIEQQPGIKYNVTADDFGASSVVIRREDEEDILFRGLDHIIFK